MKIYEFTFGVKTDWVAANKLVDAAAWYNETFGKFPGNPKEIDDYDEKVTGDDGEELTIRQCLDAVGSNEVPIIIFSNWRRWN